MDNGSIGFKEQLLPNPSGPACQAESSCRSARGSSSLPRTGPPGVNKQEAPTSNNRRRSQSGAGRPGRWRDRRGQWISPYFLRSSFETPSKPFRDSFETSGSQLATNTLTRGWQRACRRPNAAVSEVVLPAHPRSPGGRVRGESRGLQRNEMLPRGGPSPRALLPRRALLGWPAVNVQALTAIRVRIRISAFGFPSGFGLRVSAFSAASPPLHL